MEINYKNIKTHTITAALILLLLTTWGLAACQPGNDQGGGKGDPTGTVTFLPAATQTPTQPPTETPVPAFRGEQALADVNEQVAMGPRTPDSPGHKQIVAWIQEELVMSGWKVEIQETTQMGHPIKNIIAKRGEGNQPWIILGAHYDTRLVADQDQDPEKAVLPVPGANDGASGVAVLLELARVLPDDLPKQVWLVFFDAEDNGNIPGWNWILGSTAFVEMLEGKPDAVVIVDMIGDAGLEIYKEGNSDPELTTEIWKTAEKLGYKQFMPTVKHRMLDDHTPFLRAGIRAIDIIDFDYPYWHTSEDTPDKVSAESLEAVGKTLFAWLTDS